MLLYIVVDYEERLTYDEVSKKLSPDLARELIAVYDEVEDCVKIARDQGPGLG